MKIIYNKFSKFNEPFELDLLHPDFVNTYRVGFERMNATFDDFVAINSAILEHNFPQLVVEKLISRTFITKMRNLLRAYVGKFRESEVEALQAFYHREILSIEHKSWFYVFDSSL